ncbi:MAG: TrkA family potassium uptake protein [Halobacteriales archaeon]|nr:TrkA family potassium uptake protein [Halobacteriales archaeon]
MSGGGMLRVVLVGSGRVGLMTARLLDARGHDVIVIERNHERCERIAQEYVATVIEGNAARPSVLRQADLERRDLVAAVTNTQATNLAVCMAAKRISPEIRTVMRTIYEDSEAEYAEFVDDVVLPEAAGARAVMSVVEGGVRSVEQVSGDLEIVEIEVAEGAPAAGKTLKATRFPRGSLIIAHAEGGRFGGPETVLEPGARYLVAVESDVADEVMNLLRG